MNLDKPHRDANYEGHTPRPWWIETVTDGGRTDIWLLGNHPTDEMMACIELGPDPNPEGSEANLTLIAAAPELLAEVKKLREVIKKIKDCATINAQHDDTLQEEWEYILEVMRCTEED